MAMRTKWHRLTEILRYYQAGAANALFGYSIYAFIVWLGFNIFAAQLVSHILGVAFNYATYSRHVFRDAGPAKVRFIMSYGVNYIINVSVLFAVSIWVQSPYLSGLAAIILTSFLNYFLLRHVVFIRQASQ
jgi:putative flippase GtrA